MKIRGEKAVAGAGVGILFFTLYFTTLCPGVYLGDSGELITAAALLDIPHPPGYPLYSLAGRLFAASLPDPAKALNLFSAAAAAMAVSLFFLLLRRKTGTIPSLTGAALLGLSPLLWSHASVAEVYAPHLALFLLALLFLLRGESGRDLLLAGFLSGLSLGLHPVSLGLLVLLPLAGMARGEKEGRARTVVGALLLAAAGSTIFLYLPVRSALDPPTDWGNPETIGNLFAHLFRHQYGDRAHPDFSLLLLGRQLAAGIRSLAAGNIPLVLLPLIPLGAAALALVEKKRSVPVFAGAVLFGPLLAAAVGYPLAPERVEENMVFFLPALAFLLFFLSFAVETVLSVLGGKRIIRVAFAAVLVLVVVASVPGRRERHRFDLVFLPEKYARQALRLLPGDARLFATGDDMVFPLLYLKEVARLRPDVTVVNPGGTVFGASRQGDEEKSDSRPLYYTWPEPGTVPAGLLFRDGAAPPLEMTGRSLRPAAPLATIRGSAPLRSLWINYLESRARSNRDPASAAPDRYAALVLAEKIGPGEREWGIEYARASLLAERGRLEEAYALAGSLIGGAPDDSPARLLAAELLLRADRQEDAIRLASPAGETSVESLTRSAAVLLYCGRDGEAKRLLEEAIRKDRLATKPLLMLQKLSERNGLTSETIRLGTMILDIDPDEGEARFLLARAFQSEGDQSRAGDEFGKLLRFSPDHPRSDEAREFLEKR